VKYYEGEERGMWKLYFDVDDDGLEKKLGKRARGVGGRVV
jgi:hypothetical protein